MLDSRVVFCSYKVRKDASRLSDCADVKTVSFVLKGPEFDVTHHQHDCYNTLSWTQQDLLLLNSISAKQKLNEIDVHFCVLPL